MNMFTKIILGTLTTGTIYQGCTKLEEPKEEKFLKPIETNIEGYVFEDYNNDTNIDCIRKWDGSSVLILYKDTLATKGIHIPGIDRIWKPMSPEMIKASNNLRDAWNMFQYQKTMQDYKLEKNN